MRLWFKKNMRRGLFISISLILWLLSLLLQKNNLILTSTASQIFSIGTMIILLLGLFGRLNSFFHSQSLIRKYELQIFLSFIVILCLIGIYESRYQNATLAIFFYEVLAFIFVLYYIIFRNRHNVNNNENILIKWGIFRTLFWMFGVFITVLLIIGILKELTLPSLKDGDIQLLNFLDPYYFLYVLIFFIDWGIRHFNKIIRNKKDKTQTELMHLKSQVNPHFFFNMLNNLYALVAIDPKKAQELILQLSEMMRYSIYEGEKNRVNLDAEVEFLKNYITLHQMRYHKTIDVQFNVTLENNPLVMPLLFIILVENAFKHGVENLRENAFVHIDLMANNHTIQFDIENNFDPIEIQSNNGIGLKNLKRRLEIAYSGRHKLSISKNTHNYKVQLIIKRK